jgi:hypothetical protein
VDSGQSRLQPHEFLPVLQEMASYDGNFDIDA